MEGVTSKDARRKALHTPEYYGKVLFLTRDGGRYCIVTEEGGVGDPLAVCRVMGAAHGDDVHFSQFFVLVPVTSAT